MVYLTMLATTFGAIGGDFWQQIMKPYFKKERAAARKDDSKSFWDAVYKEQRLLDVLSIIIARANADIIRSLPTRRRHGHGRGPPSSPSEDDSWSPHSTPRSPSTEEEGEQSDASVPTQREAASPAYDDGVDRSSEAGSVSGASLGGVLSGWEWA